MATAQMWWTQAYAENSDDTTFAPSWDSTLGELAVALRGYFQGPGCGTFTCDAISRYFLLETSFSLAPEEMPAEGTVFISQPVATFTGNVWARTFEGAFAGFGDDPSAICDLELTQEVATHSLTSYHKETLVAVIDTGIGSDPPNFPRTTPPAVAYDPVTFQLDRSQPLDIVLTIRFSVRLEGDGFVYFDHWRDAEPVRAVSYPWAIESIF